jgi:ABC-type Fe3+ transport system substrate-binding protein
MTAVTLELPDELVTNFDLKQLAKEFTDFVLSKNIKRISAPDSSTESFTDWDNAEFSEMAMNQAMRGMENEPELYTLDDLKERWQ